MPSLVYDIINLVSSLLRLLGMAALGLGIGWLALDLLKKAANWYLQAVVFLGLLGLIIAMSVFLGWGALGGFAIGLAVAIFMWGMPKKAKVDED
jgi:hypothetical protein